ncbi:L-desosaminyltransferase [Lentzea albidocapillata subsp. violacea]|uniref:L-desosaminyltransferase n=1 Tax=Lentzea albidocapillata subsp. violacea TaxID=128104 RepID=A0A1G9LQL3_9PSEU|nr:activator-dependent family glycosyltransferase [Lentzea albidocapillata]SDL64057.1 L-desosaminyltransferase [Lentzea albidocapillata subsp. violacea]
MRVLLACVGLKTHFYKIVTTAWALQTAGHEVLVASHPMLVDDIIGAGLSAVSVGEDHLMFAQSKPGTRSYSRDWDFTFSTPETLTWDYLHELHASLVDRFHTTLNNDTFVDGMVEFAERWRPDLVLWELGTYAGAFAARAAGAAHARIVWGQDVTMRARQEFLRLEQERAPQDRDDPLETWLQEVASRFGDSFDEELVTGQFTLDLLPASARLPTDLHVVPVRYVPHNGPSVVPAWVYEEPKRPRVCVTLGLAGRERGLDYVSQADFLEAVADLDVELVVTMNEFQRAQLREVPANARIVDFIPLHALLPSCAAIVHHGGSGTWATAMLAGVPQVVVAATWDTPVKAQHLERVGAGLHVPAAELTPDVLRAKVVRVLDDPAFRESAERLRQEVLSEPSPNEVVATLERLTRRYRS